MGHYEIGLKLYKSGKFDRAAKSFKKGVDNKASTFKSLIGLSESLLKIGDFKKHEDAIKLSEQIASNQNRFDICWKSYGDFYEEVNDYNKAIEYYEKAIHLNRNYHSAYYRLAMVYFSLNDYEQAIEYCLMTLRLNPRDDFTYNALGIIYF